jgi:hypothetical protein
MKRLFVISSIVAGCITSSCNNKANNNGHKTGDTTMAPDSSATNRVLPPSASPDNANNPSLADTVYKSKDTTKKK